MKDVTPKNLFLQSVLRCETKRSFITSFYKHFLSQSECIHDKFIDTDFNQQNRMLLRSLKLSAGAISGEPAALHELNERTRTHNRHHLDIQPELYQYWLDAIIKTASEFDEEWDESTENAWRHILGRVVHHMTKRY